MECKSPTCLRPLFVPNRLADSWSWTLGQCRPVLADKLPPSDFPRRQILVPSSLPAGFCTAGCCSSIALFVTRRPTWRMVQRWLMATTSVVSHFL